MLLTQASNQLFSRPPDEHFSSFTELKEACDQAYRNGVEVHSNPSQMFFLEREGALRIVLGNNQELGLTNYSLTQVAADAQTSPSHSHVPDRP